MKFSINDLVTFTEEINLVETNLMENFIFCAVSLFHDTGLLHHLPWKYLFLKCSECLKSRNFILLQVSCYNTATDHSPHFRKPNFRKHLEHEGEIMDLIWRHNIDRYYPFS